jgi:hypothetical protein
MPAPQIDRRQFLIHSGSVLGAGLLAPGVASAIAAASQPSPRDVTFFIASDTHYGLSQIEDNEKLNKDAIQILNHLAGTAFPNPEFGTVPEPRAVLVPGDLTDSSKPENFRGFAKLIVGPHVDGYVDDFPINGANGGPGGKPGTAVCKEKLCLR